MEVPVQQQEPQQRRGHRDENVGHQVAPLVTQPGVLVPAAVPLVYRVLPVRQQLHHDLRQPLAGP